MFRITHNPKNDDPKIFEVSPLKANHPENQAVINLTSVTLSGAELLALELGHGFILTPNNPAKKEEFLLLEVLEYFWTGLVKQITNSLVK